MYDFVQSWLFKTADLYLNLEQGFFLVNMQINYIMLWKHPFVTNSNYQSNAAFVLLYYPQNWSFSPVL